MIEEKLKNIDKKIEELKAMVEYGGPDAAIACKNLEQVLRDLKVFDQKRYRSEQLLTDPNRRFEALVKAMEKITKLLKDNDML